MGDFWTTFLYIVVMIAVIVGAYLATKFIAGKGGRAKSRHIRMIDRMALGRDKHIILVEVGGKDLLIGVTSQSINVLGDIGRETLEADHSPKESAPPAQKGFAAQMRDFFVNMKNAPDNLGKARMEAKKARDSKAYYDTDYLTQMDEAIQRRKDRGSGRNEEEI